MGDDEAEFIEGIESEVREIHTDLVALKASMEENGQDLTALVIGGRILDVALALIGFGFGWALSRVWPDTSWPGVVASAAGVTIGALAILRTRRQLWSKNVDSFKSNLLVIGIGLVFSIGLFFLGIAIG